MLGNIDHLLFDGKSIKEGYIIRKSNIQGRRFYMLAYLTVEDMLTARSYNYIPLLDDGNLFFSTGGWYTEEAARRANKNHSNIVYLGYGIIHGEVVKNVL